MNYNGANPESLLEISALRVAVFGQRRSTPFFPVDGVDLAVGAGEFVCLVGESGSGKTLTALQVMGLLPPSCRVESGLIMLRGERINDLGKDRLREIRGRAAGMVFQEPMAFLDPVFTAGEQIAEAMTAHGISRREALERAEALLSEVGVADPVRVIKSYPHELSGGLRQRVLIAAALSMSPPLLIADEPTTALDPTVALQILRLLDDLRLKSGMGVLLITHDFGVVEEVASRVYVMYAGKVVESGEAKSILKTPQHPYTAALLDALPSRHLGEGRLRAIPGNVHGPESSIVGCPFRPRCQRADRRCVGAPPVAGKGCGGIVRCFNPAK